MSESALEGTPEECIEHEWRRAEGERDRERCARCGRDRPPISPELAGVLERAREAQEARVRGDLEAAAAAERAQAELLARAGELAAEREAEWKTLPCVPHVEAHDEEAAVDACERARAHERCDFRAWIDKCARRRAETQLQVVQQRLSAGEVEQREKDVILAAVRLVDREKFIDTDPLRVVRGVLARKEVAIEVRNAAQVQRGELVRGRVALGGGETLIGLCGNKGVGKTVAGCYAIAREGGLYVTAYEISRPNELEMGALKRAPVLVVDQLGREYLGEGGSWALSRIEEVLDARHAGRRLTFLIGNITWRRRAKTEPPGFVDRYGTILADRMRDGAFVLFAGESMRGRSET